MKLRKKLKMLFCLALLSAFICACGAEQDEKAVQSENEKVQENVVTETEESLEEEVTTEMEVPDESANETEEAVATEPEEKPLANELIMNSDSIKTFAENLGEEDVHFIIYNDVEGYKQILNDGETYHMKKDDKIYFYSPINMDYCERNRVLTPEVACASGPDGIFWAWGYDIELFRRGEEVVTYGEELTYKDVPEPKSITCTFYKYIE